MSKGVCIAVALVFLARSLGAVLWSYDSRGGRYVVLRDTVIVISGDSALVTARRDTVRPDSWSGDDGSREVDSVYRVGAWSVR